MRTRTESAVYFYEDGEVRSREILGESLPSLRITDHVIVHPMTWEASLVLEQGLRAYCDALQKARTTAQLEASIQEAAK